MTSTAVVPWGEWPREQSREKTDDELRVKEERWHEAWRRNQLGEGTRSIARKMGISQRTAVTYIQRWERLAAGSLGAVEERDHQIALLTDLERLIYREAADGYTTWAAASASIRAVMADKRSLLNVTSGEAADPAEVSERAPQSVGRALAVVRDLGDGRATA